MERGDGDDWGSIMAVNDETTRAISEGIFGSVVRAVDVLIEAQCWGPAAAMVYVGIDTMASLARPAGRRNVTANDFKDWVRRYLKLPPSRIRGPDGSERLDNTVSLTPDDLYQHRCALVHTSTHDTARSERGHSKGIDLAIFERVGEAVVFAPSINRALLDPRDLANAFREGVRECLEESFADESKRALLETRLQDLPIGFGVGPEGLLPQELTRDG